MKTLLNYLLNKQWILSIVMCFLSEGRAELAFWVYEVSTCR